jgi:hypothetical protein
MKIPIPHHNTTGMKKFAIVVSRTSDRKKKA